ncbi:MAG: hypothetical protein K0R71_1263 [Bacillales bacterium]|jgi:spore germination protein PC|nr:hypothetical protein [Bacillales bacterium]
MQFDWNTFLIQIQEKVRIAESKISSLEMEMNSLKIKLKELEDKPSIQIDKIEYKFDQLKVETLEGTLNIGLNPADAEALEELTINQENPLSPFMFKERETLIQQISQEVYQYLDNERSTLFQHAGVFQDKPIDPQIADFVVEDLKRQLPFRINFFLDQTPIYDRTIERLPFVSERVREKCIKDCDLAVLKFFSNGTSNNN